VAQADRVPRGPGAVTERAQVEPYDLIVVGGGPAGSTAAAVAAREGLRVLLLEAASHPRPHVGESLLPGIIPILEKMGALDDVEAAGFTRKTGSTHRGWGLTPEWDLWFTDSEEYPYAWLVDRARFDEILFRAAARAGAEAHENAAVRAFLREGERVTGVAFRRRGEDEVREARAPITLDASGQAMLLARQLGLRELIPGLQHEASWAHFEGGGRLAPPRESQALFVASTADWLWHFPLSPTRTSVGVIRLEDDERADDERREHAFDARVAASAELQAVLGPGARRVTPVRNVRDWSYRMRRIAGPGWMLLGDASGFIDPVLSTGVLLAMHAGYHAATLLAGAVRGERSVVEAQDAYAHQHAALFSDMLRIVRFFYRQNLHRDDYFWESKRILVDALGDVSPRKAFMVLTSGLAQNLAFDEKRAETRARREAEVQGGATLGPEDRESLRFVCLHMRWRAAASPAALYFLIEPREPASPTLFSTRNWHLNCLAPQLGRDILRVPGLAPHLEAIGRSIREADVTPGEPLAQFWARSRRAVAETVRALPPEIELVRVFGD
jgi:halogenation protein CepH